MRRLSIRLRLTLWYIALLAVILAGFSLALYVALSQQLHQGLDDRLRAEAGSLTALLQRNEVEVEGEERTALQLPPSEMSVRLLDRSGREAFATGLLRGAPMDAAAREIALRDGGAPFTVSTGSAEVLRGYVIPLMHERDLRGFIEVAQSLDAVEAPLHGLSLILLIAIPATLALAWLGGLFIADRALRPIAAITREAQEISAQQLDRRINLDLPDDEVGRLARTFDAMLARLDAAFRRQRQFTADASHELRTPLTVMKGNIGVALNRPRSAEDYRHTLVQIESEVDRLSRLADDLLLLARSDSGRPLIEYTDLDLAALARRVIDDLRPLAEAKTLSLNLTAPDALPMRGDADRLQRVLYNLIENAIKYTQRGSVDIGLEAASPIRITVRDTGPGIAAEHLARVFERFYRADSSRTASNGTGLGLAIAHSIVTAHGGAIEIDSHVGEGTTVVVTMPAQIHGATEKLA
jgi:heavy metal sensor kinase